MTNERSNPLGVNPSEHDAKGTLATVAKVLEAEAVRHSQAAEDAELEAEPTPLNDGKSSEELANWHRHRAQFLESLASDLHRERRANHGLHL